MRNLKSVPLRQSIQVTNDSENTFCQFCTNFKTQIDHIWTKKDELIKKQNTLREHINEFQSNTETLTTSLKNLENDTKAAKAKYLLKMYPRTNKCSSLLQNNIRVTFLQVSNLQILKPHREDKVLL